jgi:hypothetical protein
MNRVLDLIGNRLVYWYRAGMTLHGALLVFLMETIHSLSFLRVTLSLTHDHFLALSLLHFETAALPFSHLMLPHFSFPKLPDLSVTAEILRGVLRYWMSQRAVHRVTLGLGRRRLSIVLMPLLVAWRALSQVGNG